MACHDYQITIINSLYTLDNSILHVDVGNKRLVVIDDATSLDVHTRLSTLQHTHYLRRLSLPPSMGW